MSSEAGNFGMSSATMTVRAIAMRIRQAALELGVKRIVIGECGHAWRVAYSFLNTLTGIGDGADANDRFAQMLQKQLDQSLQTALAHLRIYLGHDTGRAAEFRQVEERQAHHHLPRFLQRGARFAHG